MGSSRRGQLTVELSAGLAPRCVARRCFVLAANRLGAALGCGHVLPQCLLDTAAAPPVFAGPISSVGLAAAAAAAVIGWIGV